MYCQVIKPIADRVLATLLLILLLPFLAIVALIIRAIIGSPVLFRQRRPGLHGRIFTLLKFRTMSDRRDATGRLLPDSERLTPFGRFLRSTSVDELPELVNVVRGEMSLVGPRPLLCEYLDRYSPEQAHRHDVKPGITGWAQVNGRNDISWDEKFKLDIWYVHHCSSWLDLRILFTTIWRILTRHGVNQQGHATAEEFYGGAAASRTAARIGARDQQR